MIAPDLFPLLFLFFGLGMLCMKLLCTPHHHVSPADIDDRLEALEFGTKTEPMAAKFNRESAIDALTQPDEEVYAAGKRSFRYYWRFFKVLFISLIPRRGWEKAYTKSAIDSIDRFKDYYKKLKAEKEKDYT